MAGSLLHIVDENGEFTMDSIDNLGDAHKALEDCFYLIAYIAGGNLDWLNKVLHDLNQPRLDIAPKEK